MKKSETILLFFALIMCSISAITSSCKERKTNESKVNSIEDSITMNDTYNDQEVLEDYYLEEEKHFDCTVEEINKKDQTKEGVFGKYSVVTECGILFYTNQKYKIGDVLKGFDSYKHK
jgi:hypothetical protein